MGRAHTDSQQGTRKKWLLSDEFVLNFWFPHKFDKFYERIRDLDTFGILTRKARLDTGKARESLFGRIV
jgi:hypothetical protein